MDNDETGHYFAVNEDGDEMGEVIMEHVMGRKLYIEEVVEHLNGDTLDNRRENLRVRKILGEEA